MELFKILSIFLVSTSSLILLSCSTKSPNIENPSNGIVALSYYARNTSRLGFARYYEIFSNTNPNVIIELYPKKGLNFSFSPELPPGLYNFDKIKVILLINNARSNLHKWVEEVPGGIPVEVKSGLITLADKRLYIDQYNVRASSSVNTERYFQSIPEAEMKELKQTLMGEGSTN